jgi:hypothetical protein
VPSLSAAIVLCNCRYHPPLWLSLSAIAVVVSLCRCPPPLLSAAIFIRHRRCVAVVFCRCQPHCPPSSPTAVVVRHCRHCPPLQPFVKTLDGEYVCNLPLPRGPLVQSASLVTSKTDSQHTCYLQVPRVPTWSNLTKLLAGLGRRTPFPLCGWWSH